jgi:radical SAM-linked protein
MSEPNPMRVRVTYAKQDALRYTGHLDLQRVWERILRRSGLPVLYSQGFNPLPRLQLAGALPLGIESRCEVMDFWLGERQELMAVAQALKAALPPGMDISDIREVDLHTPALETQLKSAEYRVTFNEPIDRVGLEKKVAELLKADSLPRERRGKAYDLRPLVEGLRVEPDGVLWMKLAVRPGATGRPEEVLDVLFIKYINVRCCRNQLNLG